MTKRRFGLSIAAILIFLVALISGVSFSHDFAAAEEAVWSGGQTDFISGNTGSGSDVDPYIISTAEELAYIAAQVNGGTDYSGVCFKLKDNTVLDLGSKPWSPIGSITRVETDVEANITERPFNGVFDGNKDSGSAIKNLSANAAEAGLFGYIGKSGVVKNIKIDGNNVISSTVDAGAIVGFSYGEVTNAEVVNAEIKAVADPLSEEENPSVDDINAGGAVGSNFGRMENVTVNAVVLENCHTAGGAVGVVGIDGDSVGAVSGLTVRNVTIRGTTSYGGGLIGSASGELTGLKLINGAAVTIENDVKPGEIAVFSSGYFGGLVGSLANGAILKNSCFSAEITVTSNVSEGMGYIESFGGLVGVNSGEIKSSFAVIEHAFDNCNKFGGIVGISYGKVSDVFFKGKGNGAIAGGIVGYNNDEISTAVFVGITDESGNGLETNEIESTESGLGGIAGIDVGRIDNCIVATNLPAGENIGVISGNGATSGSNNYYADGALYANIEGLTKLSAMTEPPTGFTSPTRPPERLPLISALSDVFPTEMEAAFSLSDPVTYSVDGEEITLYNGLKAFFPRLEKSGYIHNGYKGTASIDDETLQTVSQGDVYSSDWDLVPIEVIGRSEDIDISFDGEEHPLSAIFQHELLDSLEKSYVWYYSQDNDVFSDMPGKTGETLDVRNVSDSGYYKVRLTLSDEAGESVSAESEGIHVNIVKANLSLYTTPEKTVTIGKNAEGNPKTLDEYDILDEGYNWSNGNTVPTLGRNSYPAIYNPDPENYNNYYLSIFVTLNKGAYVDIPKPYEDGEDKIDGGRYGGFVLNYYALPEFYRWETPSAIPLAGDTSYNVIYNADPDYYEDFKLTDVVLHLEKGVYTGITHGILSRVYNPDLKLSDFTLDEFFRWTNEDTHPTCDKNLYDAIYCADSANYEEYALQIQVNILQATPNVKATIESQTRYEGAPYPELTIAEKDVEGTLKWSKDDGKLVSGINALNWVFVPEDSINYRSVTGTLYVNATELRAARMELVEGAEVKTNYFSYDKFDDSNLSVTVTLNSGDTETPDKDFLTISYPDGREFFLAGDTYVTISYTRKVGNTVSFNTTVSVDKKVIAKPSVQTKFTYNETAQKPTIPESDDYSVDCPAATVVGKYSATLTLTDPDYCRWEGDFDGMIPWEIERYVVAVPEVTETYVYNRNSMRCTELAPTKYYSSQNILQTNAGTYEATLSLLDKNNYTWQTADGETDTDDKRIPWTIEKAQVSLPVAEEAEYTYTGRNQNFRYSIEKNALGARTTNATQIDAGDYTVLFSLASDNYAWEGITEMTYSLPWKINPASVEKPLSGSAFTFTYDETEKVLPVPENPAYKIGGKFSATTVGNYTAVLTLNNTEEHKNYVWNDGTYDDAEIEWIINPARIDAPETGDMPTYTGATLSAPIPESEFYSVKSGGTGLRAGEYEAVIGLNDPSNYAWNDGNAADITVTWQILKIFITKPGLSGGSYTYTGATIYANIAVPEGCDISDNFAINAGNYNAKITIRDTDNYAWIGDTSEEISVAWNILPAEVAIPTARAENAYVPGGQQAPVPTSPFYTLSGNLSGTNVGNYLTTVSLISDNYIWENGSSADLSLAWRIVPRRVELPVKVSDLIYSGNLQRVGIMTSDVTTIESDTGTDCGEYTAIVKLNDPTNYVWSDGTNTAKSVVWYIRKLTLSTGTEQILPEAYVAGTPLPTPSREGFVFDGWYDNEEFQGERISSVATLEEDKTLYAKWVENRSSGSIFTPEVGGENGGLSTMAIIGLVILGVGVAVAVLIIILALTRGGGRKGL